MERWRSKPSQPNNLNAIKYVSRNSTVGDHDMAEVRLKRQVTLLTSDFGAVQVHVEDEGFDFLGFHIHRRRKRGTNKHYVYTTPSREAVQAIKDKVSAKTYRSTLNSGLDEVLLSLNRLLRGWANYFRHGVSKAVFSQIDEHAWHRLVGWIYRKHNRLSWIQLRRRFCLPGSWTIAHNGDVFTGAASVKVTRYRYRGSTIPTPWTPNLVTATNG